MQTKSIGGGFKLIRPQSVFKKMRTEVSYDRFDSVPKLQKKK